jgi:hypothetical protein
MAEKRLRAALEPMLDAIASELNDLGQQSKERAERDSYFQGAGRLQSERQAFLDGFRREFAERFDACAKALQGSGRSPEELDREAAAMLKTNVLENEVAVIKFSVKLKLEAAAELAELSRRLMTLCRCHALDDSDNPVGPLPIAHAMYTGFARARVEGRAARAVRAMVEAKFVEPVRELYRAVNQLLQALGIEPAAVRPAPAPPPAPRPAAPAVPPVAVDAAPTPSDEAAAAREVAAALSGAGVPPAVEAFLKRDWLGLLARARAEQGPDGPAWRQSVVSMRELVWSLKPKPDPSERAKLAAALPRILKHVALGMDAMDMPQDARRPVLDALMSVHREILRAS